VRPACKIKARKIKSLGWPVIPIADQVTWGFIPGKCLRDLICDPLCGRMRCFVDPDKSLRASLTMMKTGLQASKGRPARSRAPCRSAPEAWWPPRRAVSAGASWATASAAANAVPLRNPHSQFSYVNRDVVQNVRICKTTTASRPSVVVDRSRSTYAKTHDGVMRYC
jgi:hypothetical protein